MALEASQKRAASIRILCEAFAISETCYRYVPLLRAENTEISDWLKTLVTGVLACVFYICEM